MLGAPILFSIYPGFRRTRGSTPGYDYTALRAQNYAHCVRLNRCIDYNLAAYCQLAVLQEFESSPNETLGHMWGLPGCFIFALVFFRSCAILGLMKYTEKLAARIATTRSALCVGLDPRPQTENMTELADWLRKVVEETAPYAAAYKPNIAYFEAMGLPGLKMLEELLPDMPKDIPVILDAKRGDIGETQKYYAQAYFDRMDVDAVTLNPFMGYDILEPFLDRPGKAVYLLAVTTNPGSVDVEQQVLANGRKVYQLVGDMVTRSIAENSATEVGMVVGLTNANSQILTDLPDAPLLVPGLGAQGGDLSALTGGTRVAPPTINVSRGILYKDPELSFAEKAEKWATLIRSALAL